VNPDLPEIHRRRLLLGFSLSLGASLLGTPVMAAAPAPVVAVPFYGAATLLRMQRRHAWLPAARQWREAAEALLDGRIDFVLGFEREQQGVN